MGGSERAWVGLGANVGAPQSTLEAAVVALAALPGASITGVSPLYRTRPVGPVEQADFHNAVAGLLVPAGADPEAGALALLIALKSIERALGRVERERWGPRELDLDLLLFGDHRIRVERPVAARSADAAGTGVRWLEVPHPEAALRSFVLAPLADLVPDRSPPGWDITVAAALERARRAEGRDAVELVATWDRSQRRWVDREPEGGAADR